MCGQHNARASAEDNTGQNTDKGHTPNPRTEIKITWPRRESNPGRRVGRQGRYRPCHGDGLLYSSLAVNILMLL